MESVNTYRLLEVWEDCPSVTYTLEEALEKITPYLPDLGNVSLYKDHGLLYVEGTGFFLQQIEGGEADEPISKKTKCRGRKTLVV